MITDLYRTEYADDLVATFEANVEDAGHRGTWGVWHR